MAKSTKSKTKNQGGRPKVELTPEQIKEVEELASSLTIEDIADHLGISEKTFRNLKNRNEEVLTAYKKGFRNKIIKYNKLLEAKAEGSNTDADTSAIIFFLKTQAKWSTSPKEKINIDLPKDATPVELVDIAINKSCGGEISFQVAQQIADLAKLKYAMQNQPTASEAHNFFADIEEMHEMSRTFLEAHNLMEQIKVKQK